MMRKPAIFFVVDSRPSPVDGGPWVHAESDSLAGATRLAGKYRRYTEVIIRGPWGNEVRA